MTPKREQLTQAEMNRVEYAVRTEEREFKLIHGQFKICHSRAITGIGLSLFEWKVNERIHDILTELKFCVKKDEVIGLFGCLFPPACIILPVVPEETWEMIHAAIVTAELVVARSMYFGGLHTRGSELAAMYKRLLSHYSSRGIDQSLPDMVIPYMFF